MSIIKDGTPGSIQLGAEDLSKRVIYATAEELPQHLPIGFILGQKGTTQRTVVSGPKLELLYGAETLNQNGKYFNHQTLLLRDIASFGNTLMIKRLIPTDAGPRSNATVYLDVLETDVPNYLRSSSGDYIPDAATNGYKIDTTTPTVKGFKIKFIKEFDTPKTINGVTISPDSIALGLKTPKTGTMVDGEGNTSTMYPFIEIRAQEQGEFYNNIGFGFNSVFKNDIDKKVLAKTKCTPYQFFLVTRPNDKTSPTNQRSLYNETYVNVVLKQKTLNPTTQARMDLEHMFNTSFFNEKDPTKRLAYKDYEGMYLYREYLEVILGKMIEEESKYFSYDEKLFTDGLEASTSTWYDFTTDDAEAIKDELYLINLFACKTSKNIPYVSIIKDNTSAILTGNQTEVMFSSATPVFLSGGSDGTLSNDMYETLVRKEMEKYLDGDTEVHDTAVNVDSFLYDSGFTLDTKMSLINYISLRKDTNVMLSTHVAEYGEKAMSLSDSRAMAMALKTKLALAPESTYFGTSVARATIALGSGFIRNSSYTDRVPLTYELGLKYARMMGAGNGMWKSDEVFDRDPKSKVEFLIDVSPFDIPESVKPSLWEDGMIWVQPYDRETAFFPAMQTVYTDDTSVLNNAFATAALGTLAKFADKTWRHMTGSTSLTTAQFRDHVEGYYRTLAHDKFAGMFVVDPECIITEEDELRGYSWHLVAKLYGNNMKTKQVFNSEVYRMSDLNTSASN